jgi:phage-related minor tail protein
MALLVGEVVALFTADMSQYEQTATKVEQRHKKTSKTITDDKPVIDADTAPFEKSQERTQKKSRETATAIDAAFSSAWKSVVADLQRVEKEAWETGQGLDDAFTSSLNQAKSALQDLRTEAGKTGAGLQTELGGALRKIQADVKELGPAGREAGEELGTGLSEGLSEALSAAGGGGPVGDLVDSFRSGKGAMAGVGMALAGALYAGLQARWAELKVGAMIAAQTGAAASEIGRLGSMAGDMYAAGFTDSLESAGQAIAAVVNVLIPADATDEAIGRIASKVATLGTVMEEEFTRVSRSARTLLLNGMADNVSQALDMIGQANENGLNIAGDLLDTIDEYSGQFARIGLEGPEAFGLLQQAMKGGARDTDFAADSIKEFILRSQDLSVSARGFEALGMNAETMSRRIAAGGGTARDALREVLNGLQTLPPGLERNTAAVDLFGTKAEDLGDALFDMDLDNAADQFGDFAGSVEEAAQKLKAGQTGAEKFDQAMHSMKSNVGEFIDWFSKLDGSALEGLTNQFTELQLATDRWRSTGDTTWLDELKAKYPEIAGAIDQFIEKNQGAVDAQLEAEGASDATTGSYEEQIRTLEELISMERERAGGVLSLSEAQIAYQESIAAANQSLKDNKVGLDLATEGGRANQTALNGLADDTWALIESMEAQNATTGEVQTFMAGARQKFIETADAMGMSADEANALANKLGLIPGNYTASVKVLAAEHAAAQVQNLLNKIAALPPEKVITLRVNTTGTPGGHFYAGQAVGSIAEYYAAGGLRPMAGNSAGVIQSYSRTGVERVIGDNPRHDEAYIPLDPASMRSQDILDEALRRMRPGWFNGSAAAPTVVAASGPSHVDRSITVHAAPSVPTTQQLRDLQHEQEVLYGRP